MILQVHRRTRRQEKLSLLTQICLAGITRMWLDSGRERVGSGKMLVKQPSKHYEQCTVYDEIINF